MIVKFLGILDLLTTLAVIFHSFIPIKLVVYAGMYLILKGVIFGLAGDVISIIDSIVGIYVILLAYGIGFKLMTIIVVIYLLQKGLISLFS